MHCVMTITGYASSCRRRGNSVALSEMGEEASRRQRLVFRVMSDQITMVSAMSRERILSLELS